MSKNNKINIFISLFGNKKVENNENIAIFVCKPITFVHSFHPAMTHNRANRLAELRRKAGLTLKEVAERVGLSHGRIDAYESDSSIRIKRPVLEALARTYDTSVAYIEEGLVPETGRRTLEISIADVERYHEKQVQRIRIPVIPLSASATFLENVEGAFVFNWAELAHYEQELVAKEPNVRYDSRTVIFKVVNYSMSPHFKPSGRLLCTWVDAGNWQYATGVHVLSLRTGMLVLKRIRRCEGGRLLLGSDNPEYGEMWVGLDEVLAMWKAEHKTFEPVE